MLVLTLLLVGLFLVSCVSASDNQASITDGADNMLAINTNDDEIINQENVYGICNDDSNKLNDADTLSYSYKNDEITLYNYSFDNVDDISSVFSSSYDNQLCSTDLIATHFDIPNSFNKAITINLMDSSNNIVKNAEIMYSFDYSDYQKTLSGNSIGIPTSLESDAAHTLLLAYSTNGKYATCLKTVYFFKPTLGKCTLTNSGPSKSKFSITTYDGAVYGSINVKLLNELNGLIKNEQFNYYIDNDTTNQFNATSGNIVLNFTPNSYHDIVFVYNGKSSKYVPCTKTIRICYKSSILLKEKQKYYVDGGMRIPLEYFDEGSWVHGYTFVPFGTNNISLKNPYTGEVLEKEITILKRIIKVDDLITDYKDLIEYKVRAANENNIFTSNLTVTFIFDDKTYDSVTDEEGYASFKTHLKAGNYTITTRYCGIVSTNRIIIHPIYVDNEYEDMHIDSLTTYYGTDKTINYGWNGFFKGSLKIYKESILIKTIVLDNSRYFNENYTYDIYSNSISTSELKDVGTYSLKIMNQNDTIIAQSSVIIKKVPTELHVNDVYAFKNSKETTYLFLYENKKEDPDVNGVVTVKFNGNTYNVNMKNGVGKVTFKVPAKYKQYWATATFKGDNIHEPSSCKFLVDVIKYDCDVIVSDMSKVKPGAKITLKANVYYKMGTKKLTSGVIKFKVNGKTYKAKIKNGVAKLTINAPKEAKTYTCKASYAGTKDIYSSSTKFKITVKSAKKKKTTSFTVVVPTKLNQKISKSYGIYKVTTRKFISNLYYGGKNAKLQILVYKNGKPLTDFKAKYVVCISSGKQVSVTVDGNWWSRSISYNDVLNAYKIKATVWP